MGALCEGSVGGEIKLILPFTPLPNHFAGLYYVKQVDPGLVGKERISASPGWVDHNPDRSKS